MVFMMVARVCGAEQAVAAGMRIVLPCTFQGQTCSVSSWVFVIISAKCFIAGERIIQVQALIYREEHHTQRPRNALSYCTTKE